MSAAPSFAQSADAGIEQRITECEQLWLAACLRFQAHGLPADRDEGVFWLHALNQALLERSRRLGAARHAACEQRLDEGNDFFQSETALAMGRPGWRAVVNA